MLIFLISQDENDDYDTYDSAVVVAENEEMARKMHPYSLEDEWSKRMWASSPENVKVEFIGMAVGYDKPTVICASFNAG